MPDGIYCKKERWTRLAEYYLLQDEEMMNGSEEEESIRIGSARELQIIRYGSALWRLMKRASARGKAFFRLFQTSKESATIVKIFPSMQKTLRTRKEVLGVGGSRNERDAGSLFRQFHLCG